MGQWIALSWNLIEDMGIVMDADSCGGAEPTAAVFDTEEEATAYAKSVCAWNYKVVDLDIQ